MEITAQWLALWENGELSDEVLGDRVAEINQQAAELVELSPELLLSLAHRHTTSVLFVSHDRSLAHHFHHQLDLRGTHK